MAFDIKSMWLGDELKYLRLSLSSTLSRLTMCATHGALTAIHIIQIGTLPDNLSPIFLQAIVGGIESIDDSTWSTLR